MPVFLIIIKSQNWDSIKDRKYEINLNRFVPLISTYIPHFMKFGKFRRNGAHITHK